GPGLAIHAGPPGAGLAEAEAAAGDLGRGRDRGRMGPRQTPGRAERLHLRRARRGDGRARQRGQGLHRADRRRDRRDDAVLPRPHRRGPGLGPKRRAGHGHRGRVRLHPALEPPPLGIRAPLPTHRAPPPRQAGRRDRHLEARRGALRAFLRRALGSGAVRGCGSGLLPAWRGWYGGIPQLKLTFMGTAGARFMVAKQLAASGGLYLEEGKTRLCLDPGPGAIVQYAKRKVDPSRLDGIVVSHRHLDHCGDVNVMIEAMTEGGFSRRGALYCPADALDDDPVVFQYLRRFPEKVIKLQPKTDYRVGEIAFTTSPAHIHGAETYGFRFGDRLGWVTDSA